MSKPFKLRLTKLAFLSSVDAPAQGEGAQALLLKSDEVRITARVSKMSDELGLVFGHAFASSLDGGATKHVDVQNDAIDPDFLKTAMEFIEAGGPTDVNHDFEADGRIVFAWPLLPDVNEAMGIKSDVIGLAVAVKPSPETYARFKRGELKGFSIAGIGEREPLSDEKPAAPAQPQAKSTRHAAVPHGGLTMTLEDATAEIETLKAKLAETEKRAAMSDEDRAAEIEKSNPVAYRGEVSGITVRKSEATDFALKLAKAHEAQAVQLAKANEAEAVAKAQAEAAELRKRAEPVFKGLAGSDSAHDEILKAIEACSPDAQTALKAIAEIARKNAAGETVAAGIGAADEPKVEDPQVELDALVAAEMTANPSMSKAKATERAAMSKRGLVLYTEIQKRAKARK